MAACTLSAAGSVTPGSGCTSTTAEPGATLGRDGRFDAWTSAVCVTQSASSSLATRSISLLVSAPSIR